MDRGWWWLGAVALAVQVIASPQPSGPVTATVETAPVPDSGDAADDPAIWVHPTDPSLSVLIGTDKRGGGLQVSDLSGRQIQFLAEGAPNNVDVRAGFSLAGQSVDLVVVADSKFPPGGSLRIYKVDPSSRTLVNVTARTIVSTIVPHGFCMYRSPASGKFYAFDNADTGDVEQWELFDNGAGQVDATLVRGPWNVGTGVEGCVADDEMKGFYIAEQNVGIWRYGAEPDDSTTLRTLVDSTGGGHLVADVEGLAIAAGSGGTGFLFASSQGDSSFAVYRRDGTNDFVRRFVVESSTTIDGCSDTDGIEVTARALGQSFANGLFVCQDGSNTMPDANQNFKLVPLERIVEMPPPAPLPTTPPTPSPTPLPTPSPTPSPSPSPSPATCLPLPPPDPIPRCLPVGRP